jgi:hypothetical protein
MGPNLKLVLNDNELDFHEHDDAEWERRFADLHLAQLYYRPSTCTDSTSDVRQRALLMIWRSMSNATVRGAALELNEAACYAISHNFLLLYTFRCSIDKIILVFVCLHVQRSSSPTPFLACVPT